MGRPRGVRGFEVMADPAAAAVTVTVTVAVAVAVTVAVATAVGAAAAAAVRPRLVLHAPLSLLMGIDSGVAELEGVGPVAVEVARRLACDARVTLSVEGPDGSILDQGRARRDPTTAQRIEIARRDKGCRVPGCPYCEFTDVHHMKHWANGGLTNLDNLITLCGRHHNAVHELGWSMRGDANGEVTFVTPTGQTMISVPSPTWRAQSESSGEGRRRRGRAGSGRGQKGGSTRRRTPGPALPAAAR